MTANSRPMRISSVLKSPHQILTGLASSSRWHRAPTLSVSGPQFLIAVSRHQMPFPGSPCHGAKFFLDLAYCYLKPPSMS